MSEELETLSGELPASSAALLAQVAFAEAVLFEVQRKLGAKSAHRILTRWRDNLEPEIETEHIVLIRGQAQRLLHLRHKRAAFAWVTMLAPVLMKRLME